MSTNLHAIKKGISERDKQRDGFFLPRVAEKGSLAIKKKGKPMLPHAKGKKTPDASWCRGESLQPTATSEEKTGRL